MSGRESYTSRNGNGHWSRRNYTYYVGQRVIWPMGERSGIPFGVTGTVVSLPEPGERTLIVDLDDRAGVSEFTGGSGLVPLRKVWEASAKHYAKLAARYRDSIKETNQLGMPLAASEGEN